MGNKTAHRARQRNNLLPREYLYTRHSTLYRHVLGLHSDAGMYLIGGNLNICYEVSLPKTMIHQSFTPTHATFHIQFMPLHTSIALPMVSFPM